MNLSNRQSIHLRYPEIFKSNSLREIENLEKGKLRTDRIPRAWQKISPPKFIRRPHTDRSFFSIPGELQLSRFSPSFNPCPLAMFGPFKATSPLSGGLLWYATFSPISSSLNPSIYKLTFAPIIGRSRGVSPPLKKRDKDGDYGWSTQS